MLSSFKGKSLDEQRSGATPSNITPTTPATPTTSDTPTTRDVPETISAIGSGMTIVGKIVCDGVLHIFGRIEGELRATNVLIADHANVQGDVIADELTVEGDLKGTIHATRVRIRGTGSVQGDIFHQSLAIEENAQFEGMSRRQENPTAAATSAAATSAAPTIAPAADADGSSQGPARVASIDSYRRLDNGLDNESERVTAG
jgi:cytoskeletal protein CcmA (bactofilin family)